VRARMTHARWAAAVAVSAALCVSPAGAGAEVPVEPYGANDAGGFRNIIAGGEDGLVNATELAEFEAKGTVPPHFKNQLPMYSGLIDASPTLTHEQIPLYFKDATFGVKEGEVQSTESPRSDVTIERDKGYGIPHIYASTRGGVMFGAGYAGAEDRLFLMDVLRHAGRAELSSFAGGAEGNRAMDRAQWLLAPYTEADLESQLTNAPILYGAAGTQVVEDVEEFVAGINAYIDAADLDPNLMPAEYLALGKTPEEWKPTDVIAEASLIGGIFGKGGGAEVQSALTAEAFEKQFGKSKGRKAWKDFREQNDPEAPTTLSKSFPYETASPFSSRGLAMPEPGSVEYVDDGESSETLAAKGRGSSEAPSFSAGGARTVTNTPDPQPIPNEHSIGAELMHNFFDGPALDSNWELVNKELSTDGHSIAVMGPQVGYYDPEILMEEDLHGPGIDADGAAFPGVNLYVELGHGTDYAWSATTSTADNIDTFAEVLCEGEYSYLYNGKCVPMEKLVRENSWTPNADDETPPGKETLTAYRTVHGIVFARGKVDGKKVAFASARTTYFHEADSAIGFSELNEPGFITGPKRFEEAASHINFLFNWAYVDANNIAYYMSGWLPEKAKGVSPDFPVLGTGEYDWQGFNPTLHTEDDVPFKQHPNAINPPFLVSWNNKQAPKFSAADDKYAFGTIYRMQLIRNFIEKDIEGGKKMAVEQLISAMDEASTQDIRMVELWPILKEVLGAPSNPKLQEAIAKLEAWYAAGGHRRDLANTSDEGNGTYEDNEAITIMDAWWPKLLEAEFRPALGSEAFDAVEGMLEFGAPYPGGEPQAPEFADGWYGYVDKDLRDLLAAAKGAAEPTAPYSRIYCGDGSFEACQAALQNSLLEATSQTPAQIYGHGECKENAQASCYDLNRFTDVSGIPIAAFPFQNRPTFQQVVELTKTLPAPR
jgi:acyl-homoserine lactone acylase PvdQ